MTIEAKPAAAVEEVKTVNAKVTNIRIGKRGQAITLSRAVLKKAGWPPGSRLHAIVLSDGSILLRREAPLAQSEEALFEQCAAEVLRERRELLERLAK